MAKEKQLCITLEEAEQELVAAVNGVLQKHNLPHYLVEPIVDKIHRQLIDGKRLELEAARAEYATDDPKEEQK